MHSRRFRGALSLMFVASFGALGWLAACGDDSSSGAADFDAGEAGFAVDGNGGGDGRSPGDNDGSSIGDAGADVDPYADADMNCAHYSAMPFQSPVTVNIVNQTGAPIYLGKPTSDCQPYVPFGFKDGADAAIAVATLGDNDCKWLQEECTTSTCPVNLVTKLADTKKYDTGWPGTVFVPKYMPPSCYADAACVKGPCMQEIAATDGFIEVTVYSGVYCDGGTACNDCTVGANGNCIVSGAVGTNGTAKTVRVPWTPGTSTVTLTVQ